MQRIRLVRYELDRYLEDWATVVVFRQDGGVGYPDVRLVGGSGGLKNVVPTIGARYLDIERMLGDDRAMRAVADALYVRRIQTIEEWARQACGADLEWAMGMTWLYGELWGQWRSKVRRKLFTPIPEPMLAKVEPSQVARAQVAGLPSYGQITEQERRAIAARMGVGS